VRWRLAALAGAAALVLLASLVDRALSAPFYDPALRAFPLKDAWLLAVPGHAGLKWLMVAFWALCLARGGDWRRGALYMAAIALVVSLLKHYSPYSCPWDLPDYGGGKPDAGACVPAAHPVSGFALFGLSLALADEPRKARIVMCAGWIIGLAAGAVQVARGAHFVSHVLWTAWVAWAVTLALAAARRREPA
jgi:membrane-associated PAP2 superfamily phosphatase